MKKYYFFTLAALTLMGCAEVQENLGSGSSNNGTILCGNGAVDAAAGEVCDTNRELSCLVIDSTKTWVSGKPTCNNCKSVDIGTCVEALNNCGKPEAKCEKGQEFPCSTLDSSKEWKEGGIARCSDDCASIVPNTCVQKSICGDGILQDDEKCDKALALTVTCYGLDDTKNWKDGGVPSCASDCSEILLGTCQEDNGTVTPSKCHTADAVCQVGESIDCAQYDSSKTWKDGGKAACASDCSKILIGTCMEQSSLPSLTKCHTADAVCQVGESIDCAQYDSSKTWKDGGKAACASDCSKILVGTCQEDNGTTTSSKCNTTDAVCQVGESIDCAQYDSRKTWKDGGKAACASDCSEILIGTCEEDTTTPVEPSSKCGNSIIDAGETCEFTGKKACKDLDKKWTSGNATCNNCVLDDSKCILNETKSGLYFCQLLGPVIVTFNSDKKSEKMTVKYNIGNDVNESGMTAELVYGNDFKHMSKWKTIAATQNASSDTFTATLTDANVLSVGSADSSAYYTFRIKANNAADWQYCKRNNPNNYADPNIIDTTIASPYNLKSDGEISSNKNETGMATVSSVLAGNMIAEFNFNDATKTVSSHKANTPYAADDGKGTFVGDGKGNSYAQCNSNQCFVNGNGSGKAINLKNWVTSSADALDSNNVPQKAHITLKEMSTIGASGIDLKLDVWRNAAESATNIIVIYSTDGTSFTYVNDINLNTEKLKQYFTHTVKMPSGIENKSNVTIKLIPYGGNGLLRFDNIIVSQGNE